MSSQNKKNESDIGTTTYGSLIEAVAKKVCDDNKRPPTCAKYEQAVAEKINNDFNYGPKHALTSRDIHSTVYRALQKLVYENKFFRMEKYYYPNTPEYSRMYYKGQIKKNIRFAHGNTHIISDNTCVITLEKAPSNDNENYADTILSLFENFIGEDNCYALKILDNILIIMLQENNPDMINHITKLVKEAYSEQGKTKIKTKNKNEEKLIDDICEKLYNYEIWGKSRAERINSTVVLYELNNEYCELVSDTLLEAFEEDIDHILTFEGGFYIILRENDNTKNVMYSLLEIHATFASNSKRK